MATATATVSDFVALLKRSQLLPEATIDEMLSIWKNEAAPAENADTDVDGFRKFMVQKQHLTDYQGALLQRGRADGFFIGGYVIQDRIGRGGRSAGVYRAVHASGQVVALKVLPASKARSPQVLARFQREGRLLTQLDHPNIVRAYQLGTTSGVHYIVMEHIEGETLDEILNRRKQLPTEEAVRITAQALQGLDHLHSKRMVHRDLKPANLMVTPRPAANGEDHTLHATLKILDIGLGRELFDEEASITHDAQLTTEGAVLGTPDYLAPEQARDARSADIRSDIYSLGCVLYHMLAGRPPFVEKNVMAIMVRHATEPVPPIQQYAPAVPPGLLVILNKMLAKNPAHRYDTPGKAAEALQAFMPTGASDAMKAKVIPAYQEWLESESGMAPVPEVVKPAPAEKNEKRPVQINPVPGTGTGPALPTRASLRGNAPRAEAPFATVTKPPLAPRPPVLPPESIPDIDVELVIIPGVQPESVMTPEEMRVVAAPPARPLYDLDRRDFIMLATGAGGVVTAILGGFITARAMKHKVQGEEEVYRPNQP